MCGVDRAFCVRDSSYDWDEDEDPSDEQWDPYPDGGSEPDPSPGNPEPDPLHDGPARRSTRLHELDKRMGKRRTYDLEVILDGVAYILHLISRAHPGPSNLLRGINGRFASPNVFV